MNEVLIAKEEEVKVTYQIKNGWEAPLKEKTELGRIIISINDEIMREYVLQTKVDIEEINLKWCMEMIIKYFLNIFFD